ncbi:MAG TPA: hypothetical protein VE954_21420 [Oligoflexus sp.]|nr:hypothetical protein [Oligoflexus sp.]
MPGCMYDRHGWALGLCGMDPYHEAASNLLVRGTFFQGSAGRGLRVGLSPLPARIFIDIMQPDDMAGVQEAG